jgi:hypothetical protein
MKVGDLVKRKPWKTIEHNPTKTDGAAGIVIESGVYVGGKNVKVMWSTGINAEKSHKLEVISESR